MFNGCVSARTRPAQFGPEPYSSFWTSGLHQKVLVIIRNINLVAIHPTVKTVGFLAESCVKTARIIISIKVN
jgi:hypothetical protein